MPIILLMVFFKQNCRCFVCFVNIGCNDPLFLQLLHTNVLQLEYLVTMSLIIVQLPVFKTTNYLRLSPDTFFEETINTLSSKAFCMIFILVMWTLNYFETTFLGRINKHKPLKRFRVSTKDNP